ncbi:anti-anti-sigma factor [Salipaludibacillus neizhouensis]|uniref:Anti-anti-sigma factor n=2 Tax=Salipaludibacillus neizhouensis TaxID=885475 RepID=A0A3A9KUU0_9BACI|nr:STAS domain-containing protein [Salipaludibacillus neizhouensis]RKL68366.1 anti-anti-sigma factor [Salipaludibacillus neizhouensis]
MTPLLNFSRYISEDAESLASEVVEGVLSRMKLDIPQLEKEQANVMYIELFGFLGESLIDEDKEVFPDTLIEWSKKNAEMQVSSGGGISEIVRRYPPTREVFNEIITGISIEIGLSVNENAFVLKRVNTLLDVSLNETFLSFERLSDKFKKDKQKELLKLSAPIVPVKDNTVILPLIGDVDTNSVKHILDNVVPRIAEMGVKYVIADFSGALTINVQIAQSLHKIGGTLRLMGIDVVIAGLRPDMVQTVVKSNIDMSAIKSFASVKQALESIQEA